MNDPFTLSHGHLTPVPRGRIHHGRSPSEFSPARQRPTDDLLFHLTPRTVVDAFRNPSGALKLCMDASTPSEQAFALRAAIASKNIKEWLDELNLWPWPKSGGSAGFEMGPADRTRRKLFDDVPSGLDKANSSEAADQRSPTSPTSPRLAQVYMGSLTAADVIRYERRIDEISQAMEELDVEEIKSQVLHNHIMPLSRPGTPMSISDRSVTSSMSTYVRMDDLTALITATTIQALPNLSRLTRLMNAWSARLVVLRKIPPFLASLEDGRIALRSGWNVIGDGGPASPSKTEPSTLSRNDFEVMKSVLERKVAKAGQNLDSMLDVLEGRQDTVPDEWIDRMDSLEREYAEWVTACERKLREADLVRMLRATTPARSRVSSPVPAEQQQQRAVSTTSSIKTTSTRAAEDGGAPIGSTAGWIPTDVKEHVPEDEPRSRGVLLRDQDGLDDLPAASAGASNGVSEDSAPVIKVHPASEDHSNGAPLGPDAGEPHPQTESLDESDDAQPELPTLPNSRRNSDFSNTSTIVHGAQSGFVDSFSDQPDLGTPELPRLPYRDMSVIPSDDLSPPSSPPAAFRSSIRSLSVSFNDMPTVAELPSDESAPMTPARSSFAAESSFAVDDDISTANIASPSRMSATSADDQLQQQISEILESVPAKIRLTSEPTAINLNPPDFTMPTRKPSKPDIGPRSQSSLSTVSNMSSRAGTPSFTLAPAYARNSRPRHQRGNQEIKLYHLSRSNGEAPIKLFIRCVGENGERVMVRVGGGWADLGEYLKEYASHHGRRSAAAEVRDLARGIPGHHRAGSRAGGSSPPSRPQSAQDFRANSSPATTPLNIRKTRRTSSTPSSEASTRSRSSSRLSWAAPDAEESLSLGMAGPRAKQIEMSEESKAWVESVKEKVRIVSGGGGPPPLLDRKVSAPPALVSASGPSENKDREGSPALDSSKFGEIGKVGATKRLFRRQF
ncbi:hypothetical protein QBC46DRAFT_304011 [Diplogelasinospora grovesii]|uniref:GAR domain-containing protein n=1 Tax=Diplogelasinospora grovesii TaxID=303347 RepID=A0AAN6NG82_9PEZI|nr:hypothetical protein QBC46DRAFT_304011 [Diplogelasinospora grovesii]